MLLELEQNAFKIGFPNINQFANLNQLSHIKTSLGASRVSSCPIMTDKYSVY